MIRPPAEEGRYRAARVLVSRSTWARKTRRAALLASRRCGVCHEASSTAERCPKRALSSPRQTHRGSRTDRQALVDVERGEEVDASRAVRCLVSSAGDETDEVGRKDTAPKMVLRWAWADGRDGPKRWLSRPGV